MLKEVDWPYLREYRTGSENEPIEFYLSAFANSNKCDLLLGYFSFSAISVLSLGFAQFISNGGTMRVVANNILSQKDKDTLIAASKPNPEDELIDLTNLDGLRFRLDKFGRHFFDCMAWLIRENRLQIVLVRPKNKQGISHYKSGVFDDGRSKVSFSGSCNFTAYGLVENLESLEIYLDWEHGVSAKKISNLEVTFERMFSKADDSVEYIPVVEAQVAVVREFGNRELDELLVEEKELRSLKNKLVTNKRLESLIESLEINFCISSLPRFPFPSGPREYQSEAYSKWVKNSYSGVFAMATGTGKTITSLNCLLNEYQINKSYQAIILVPSIALLNQWESEVASFGFKNVIKVGGGNVWEPELAGFVSNYVWGTKEDLVIISTYGSFITDKFQKYFKKVQSDFMLIADEAHNMGARNIKMRLSQITCKKRIGLSATPKRVYDIEGTEALDDFFNDAPPYTYEFGMERALQEGFLSEYKYFPVLVELNELELEEYSEISRQLLRYFDFEKGEFKKDPIVEILLLKRKNIIHKASNKIQAFKQILNQLEKLNVARYIFTYIPEGYVETEEGSERMLNQFIRACAETMPNLKLNSYTSEDEDLKGILRGFSEGKIDLLFAMKMLDEGIDVPRAEVGIFCSSTGNPRQFVQRRGRLLRKHPAKTFATIFDMVVIPRLSGGDVGNFTMEKNMVRTELQRVGYFASLSMNFYDSKEALEEVCSKYDLSLDQIISEL